MSNVFRFTNYKDAIKKKVIISFKSCRYLEDEAALDSYFAFSVEQWSHSTPSEAYAFFRKKISPYIVSLKLIILHQETIASELWFFLNQCNPEALSPALDLIACLSCDLRGDFYNYIDQFLPDIFRIISENCQNADILQSSFNCLAHIVYFLHKPMVLDVQNTIKLFTPLLVNKTKHIPHFAAECLAFVLRKVSDRRLLLFQVWQALKERLDLMGLLLREVLCGSNGKLHSIAYELLPLTLDIVCEFDTNSFNTRASTTAQVGVRKGLQSILKKCPVSDTSVHVQCAEEKNKFLTKLPAVLKVAVSSLCAEFIDADEIRYIVNLVTERFESMKEKFKEDCFENMVSILACLESSMKRDNLANLEDSYGQAFNVALSVHSSVPLLTCFSHFVREPFRRYNPFTTVRNVLLSSTYSVGHRMNFILDLSDWTLFDRDVLPSLGDFLGQLTDPGVTCEEPNCRPLCGFFDFLLHLSVARLPPPVEPCSLLTIDHENSLCFHLHEKRSKITTTSLHTDQPMFVNWILNALENLLGEKPAKLKASLPVNPFGWILAFCLPYISNLPMGRVCRILYHGWKILSDKIIRGEYHFGSYELTFDLLSLLILVETRSHFRSLTEEVEPLLSSIEFLTKMASNLTTSDPNSCCLALRVVDVELCSLALPGSPELPTDFANSCCEQLFCCLQSASHQVRLHTLRIFTVIYGLANRSHRSDEISAMLSVLSRCLSAERLKLDAQSVREFLIPILHLHAHRTGVRGHPVAARLALHHLLGLLHIQLTSTWSGIQEAVASFAELPREQTTIKQSPSVGKPESDISQPIDDWRHVACRLYWSVMEPMLEQVSRQALNNSSGASNAAQSDPEANCRDMPVQSRLLMLYRAQPDQDQLVHQSNGLVVTEKPIDWFQYYASLWRCLRPQSAGKKTRLLTPLLLQLIEFNTKQGFSRGGEELLLVALGLFCTFNNIKSIYQEAEFRRALYELLTNRKPTIQKAAFHCLLAYKDPALNTYKEQLERIIEPRTFRDEIRTFKLDTAISNPTHRAHVAPILLRILYGRLQLSNKAFAPAIFTNLASCSSSEFHMFLEMLLIPLSDDSILPSAHCEQTSINASTSLVASIRDLRDRVRRTCHGEQSSISWPKLQALSKVLNHVLDYMGHRLDTTSIGLNDESPGDSEAHGDADILLRLGLCLTAMVQTVRDLKLSSIEIGQTTCDDQSFRLPAAAQVKRVRSTGVRLLEHLFTSRILLSEHFWNCPERLDAVKDVCLHQSSLDSLLTDSTIVKSHLLLTLALPWSVTSQLADSLLGGAALETLMKLLSFPKLNSSVVECILEVVTNLLFSPDVQQVGRHLMGPHHPRLIAYLHDRMKQLSQQKTVRLLDNKHSSLRLQREFRILAYLATRVTVDSADACVMLTGAEADRLLQGLLSLLTRANLRQSTGDRIRVTHRPLVNSDASAAAYESQLMSLEAVEAALVRAVTQLIQNADNLKANLTRSIHLFARLDSRVCRSLLCQAVGAGVRRIPPIPLDVLQQLTSMGTASNEPLSFRRLGPYLTELIDGSSNSGSMEGLVEDLLSRLNSWEPNRLDQPDSARREHAFGLLSELSNLLCLERPPDQTVFLHLGGLNCALHTLTHADLQLRDAALDYCLHLVKVVSSKVHVECSWPYRTLILGCLWPGLLRTLRQSRASGPKRLHLLRLLNGLVRAFREYPRFMPLALLSDFHSSTVDFYSSLQSGTMSRQAYAIRRLALFLRNPLTIVSKHRISGIRSTLSLTDSEFIIPERDLHDLFLPILQFYLNSQLQSNMEDSVAIPEQKRLLEHCLDALGALATYLSWPAYQKLVASYLNKLKTSVNSLLAARLMIVLIDAFQPPAWSTSYEKLNSNPDDTVSVDKPDMNIVKCRKVVQAKLNQNQPDEYKSILNFMLSVCKQLEPYIAKPYEAASKSQDRTSASASKTFRISLAICLVSLLRRLPTGYLESRLPHLVLRVVDVLRPSQTISPRTRSEAVKSLTRISRMLGPGKALDSLVNVVSQQLGRGYAAKQIRLFSLHKILAEVESAIMSGELVFKAGQLDTVGRILTVHYLDELVGSLAEEMDSRRVAGHSLSSIQADRSQTDTQSFSSAHLGGSNIVDLPEATGLKAPEGLTRLCRLLSHNGLMQLFEDIQKAICTAAMGKTLKRGIDLKSDDEVTKRHTDDSLPVEVGCGLRFRNRALARLDVTLAGLPTRNGMFTARQSECLQTDGLVQLASLLISKNISQVLSVDHQHEVHAETGQPKQKKPTDGWVQPRSALLEPRWNYLEIEPEPTRERNSLSAQSELTQAHLLVGCGLQILVGLLRYRWLKHGNVMDMTSLGNCIPLILDCMRSKYVRVSGAALRCLNLLLVIATSRSSSLIPQFSDHLRTAGERLFDLLATHPGLLSTKTAAADMYAQQFASNLYRALASLVRHQTSYPLSRPQLLTLLNSVDVELTRDAATTPSLSLLQAILQRRLRDPTLQREETDFLALCGDPELNAEFTNRPSGLVVAKSADRDQHQSTGAGGGARLLDLVDRVQHLAITSPSEKIRADSRGCLITFLLNYPHKAKFVQSFVAFCLRQLEYKKPTGRLSAVSLLTGLVSDLPISRLTANNLDEAILVSVGAAIERESVRSIRVGLLAVIRLLFTRLPAQTAEAHFRDYLLAFAAAPAATRCSARLLGLQLIGVVLDSQPCLTVKKYRPLLIRLLGTDTLPTAAKQLYHAVLSNPAVRSMSGISVLFGNTELCPAEEVEVAKAATEDATWVAELSCVSTIDQMDVDPIEPTVESDVEENMSRESLAESDDTIELNGNVDSNEEVSDIEREPLHFEEAEDSARLTCDSLIGSTHPENQRMCKSAVDNHYFLVACTLEFALQLVHRLVHTDTDGTDSEFVPVSATMIPVWRSLVGFHQASSNTSPDSSTVSQLPTNVQKLHKRYATLFKTTGGKSVQAFSESDHWSLLCAGHRGVREWASRCLVPLLRLEVVANQNLILPENALLSEGVGPRFKSAFFCELLKKHKLRIFLLERLLYDSLFQLEHDAREPLNEEWSDALVANLVHLGQLLHLTVGRKPVLRLFRRANRIALDELNCRPHCYIQRTLTLKLITGLLLRLPHPQPTELSKLLFNEQTQSASDADGTNTRAPAYVAYVRAASRHLAREFRQRERLTFMAAASTVAVHDEDAEAQVSSARIRLGGICLSREQSTRARARRKKTQARLRRALMLGTVRPETAQSLVAAAAASRAHAGPDQLIHMIEATETALSEGLGGGNRQLVHSLCTKASLGAKARQQAHRVKKAAKTALGLVWKPLATTESDIPSVPVKTVNQRIQTKRKLKALQCSEDAPNCETATKRQRST